MARLGRRQQQGARGRHERRDDDRRGDPGEAGPADPGEPGAEAAQRQREQLLCQAANGGQHAEGDDERGQPEPAAQDAVHRADQCPGRERPEQGDGGRLVVLPRQPAPDQPAEGERGADRQVEVAADDEQGQGDGDDGEGRGVGGNAAEVGRVEEAARGQLEDQHHSDEHDEERVAAYGGEPAGGDRAGPREDRVGGGHAAPSAVRGS
nr:hypothetical protein [Streptomyces iakyrus]